MPGNIAFRRWYDRIRSRCRREGAQTMAEYALTLAVITPEIIIAYGFFSDDIGRLIDSVRSIL
jgi:Flp pilus assembly pilin Flp